MEPLERLGWRLCADELSPGARTAAADTLRGELPGLRSAGRERMRAHVLMCLAAHELFRGSPAAARTLLDEAMAVDGGAHWPATRLAVLQLEGTWRLFHGDPIRAVAVFLRMLRQATAAGIASYAGKARLNLAYVLSSVGDHDGAREMLADARTPALISGASRRRAEVTAATLVLAVERGDEGQAQVAAARFALLLEAGGEPDGRALALYQLFSAILDARGGDEESALEAVDALVDHPHLGLQADRALLPYVRGLVALAQGAPEAALVHVAAAHDELASAVHLPRAALIMGLQVRALIAAGEPEAAAQVVERGLHSQVAASGASLGASVRQLVSDHLDEADALRARELATDNEALRRLHKSESAARAAAEEAARARHRFLATMSHEIRTPMTGVVAAVELLERSPLQPRQSELVGVLGRSAALTMRILDDVLELGRLESGRFELIEAPFALLRPAELVLEMLVPKAEAGRVALWLEHAHDLPERVSGDPGRLEQVLLNLVSNAIKFTSPGEVRLRIERGAEDMVRFSVIDDGIGMSDQVQARLFRHYSQASPGTSATHGGTGLGLAICKGIVTVAGGRIGVESAPGAGATFWFELPLPVAAELPAVPARPVPTLLEGLRVLVAEDNPTGRELAVQLLEQLGASVSAVDDGVGAVRAGLEEHFDLVFMDMHMPRMDGLRATRRLRAQGYTGPVVALSAAALAEDRAAARAAGMDAFVSKPIRLERLSAIVRGVLGPPYGVSRAE